jgi:ketosteroid isomerase-like protein
MKPKAKRIISTGGRLVCLLLVCAALSVAAQTQKAAPALREMVNTERAFSRMSEEKGIREAFAAFIADDGILFRPRAVVGKKWMQEHPLPPSNTRPLLTWQPIYAFMSRSGDLGYTTGPWQYKNDIKDAKPSAFGNFMTIWKKQAGGKWRFVLDLGISNPEPKLAARSDFPKQVSGRFNAVDIEAARADLMNEERELSKASADLGAAEAFLLKADIGVRVYRENKMPFIGRAAAAKAMYPPTTIWEWTPAFADVSRAGDLAYSYGTYELRDKKSGAVSEGGNYARVWKKVASMWRVVIDVANPVAPEKS